MSWSEIPPYSTVASRKAIMSVFVWDVYLIFLIYLWNAEQFASCMTPRYARLCCLVRPHGGRGLGLQYTQVVIFISGAAVPPVLRC